MSFNEVSVCSCELHCWLIDWAVLAVALFRLLSGQTFSHMSKRKTENVEVFPHPVVYVFGLCYLVNSCSLFDFQRLSCLGLFSWLNNVCNLRSNLEDFSNESKLYSLSKDSEDLLLSSIQAFAIFPFVSHHINHHSL